jgi:uroporphyrinogen-III synthase
MRVVLTREAGRNDQLRAWLHDAVDIDEIPLTRTETFEDDVAETIEALRPHEYRYLVVTSARAADVAARAAAKVEAPVLSVGPVTSAALAARGVDVAGEATSAHDVAGLVEAGPVLSLGARETRPELADTLGERGVSVTHVACYATVPVELTPEQAGRLGHADVIFIGAPSAWAVAQPHVREATWVVVPGETTGDAVRASHARVHVGWGPDLAATLLGLVS